MYSLIRGVTVSMTKAGVKCVYSAVQQIFEWPNPRGGGGGTLIFHTYVGSGYFFGFNILNFKIFGVFRKINVFWGMKILWIFFDVITKLDYI